MSRSSPVRTFDTVKCLICAMEGDTLRTRNITEILPVHRVAIGQADAD